MILHIKNTLQFEFLFQTASYKPSVYVESESSHRPSGRVLQRIAAVRGVQRESRQRERRRSALAGRHKPPVSNRGANIRDKIHVSRTKAPVASHFAQAERRLCCQVASKGANMLKDLNLVGGMTNTDWLNQFHDEMRTHKITQGQLAKTADYSRSHLNQLLTGNKPINQQARLRLTLALRSLTGQNNVDVCIDYLGVTFKSHDYEELVMSV